MKIILTIALTLLFSQGLIAEENTTGTEDTVSEKSNIESQPILVTMINKDTGLFLREENPFKPAELDLKRIEFYNVSGIPSFKPGNTILLGGVLPLNPMRLIDDDRTDETELFQKSVSLFLYFKQKF